MNEEECRSLLDEVLAADRVIHEQQLGLPWPAPDLYVIVATGDNIAAVIFCVVFVFVNVSLSHCMCMCVCAVVDGAADDVGEETG